MDKELQSAIELGIINMDDVRDRMRESRKQKLLSKHTYDIWQSDSDGRWKTYLPDTTQKKGRRLIAKSTKEKLLNEVVKFYADQEDEEYIRNYATVTFRQLYLKWLESKSIHTNSTSYIKRINTAWNAFYKDDPIADMALEDLTESYLDDWIHGKIKKYNMDRKQYYNMSIILREALDYACRKGVDMLDENPYRKIVVNKKLLVKQRKPQRETQVFLVNEQKLVADECSQRFNRRPACMTPLMILLNFQLGLRIGELVSIKWSDVGDKYLQIQRMEVEDYTLVEKDGRMSTIPNGYKIVNYNKSDAGTREVFLNSEAKKILELVRNVHSTNGYADDDFIFISSQTKRRGNSRTITKYLEKICDSIAIPNKSNHKIRKTYISSLFDKGVNIDTIRRQAGHEDERTSLNNYCFDQSENLQLEAQLEGAKNIITAKISVIA